MSDQVMAVSEKESDCDQKKVRCKSLNVMGTKYRTTLTKKYENRSKYEPVDINKVKSVIPGTILEINAKVGDVLEEGDSVLVLEAMKMYNQILMPVSGKIKAIYVKEGDAVSKNTLMFEVE